MSAEEEADQVFESRTQRARRPRPCGACKETIRAGDLYTIERWMTCGYIESVDRCMRCEKIYQHLCEIDTGDVGPAFDLSCGHTYQEVHEQEPPDEIAALAFALPGDFNDDR